MLPRFPVAVLLCVAVLTAQDGPKPGDVKINKKDTQKYVWIPPGKFTMGCSTGDTRCDNDERPAHSVELPKGFWIAQTSTPVGIWRLYRAATGKDALPDKDNFGRQFNEAIGDDSYPAVAMTWPEAQAFCSWAGGRLPTEAEWEYSARAGNPTARYGYLDAIAWYADNSGKERIESLKLWQADQRSYPQKLFDNGVAPHPVGQKDPNRWNLHDMLGNVWQWTADWYDARYFEGSEPNDPHRPATGTKKVVRGGAWYSIPTLTRVSSRNSYEMESRNVFIGVRCVLDQ